MKLKMDILTFDFREASLLTLYLKFRSRNQFSKKGIWIIIPMIKEIKKQNLSD